MVGTYGDRVSRHFHPGWFTYHRPGKVTEDHVPPGGVGTFRFKVSPAPGGEPERFQLVVSETTQLWLPPTEFGIDPRPHPMDAVRRVWEWASRAGRRAKGAAAGVGRHPVRLGR